MSEGACDRFEREGLLQLEQGRALDPHFDDCPDCRRSRAAYEQLGAELAALGGDLEPPPQWQARTWARIDDWRARRRRRQWWLAPAAAVAAAAAVMVLTLRVPPPAGLEVTVEHGRSTLRGVEAQPGDRLMMRAPTGDAVHAELRLYRDDAELVLRCSTEAPCRRRGGVLEATVELPAIGSYQPLLLLAGEPLPVPTGQGLDADAERALAAGARVELGDEIHVR